MAAAAPILLGAVGGGAVGYGVATAVGLGVTGTAVATAAGAVVGASLMMPSGQAGQVQAPDVPAVATPETDTTPVDTTSPTGGPDTTINDVVSVQDDISTQADTSTPVVTDVAEEDIGTTVQTPGGGTGTIVEVTPDEVVVDVASGTTTSGGVQTGGTTTTSAGTAGGGTAEATVAATQSVGPAEDEAISFYEKGRRSTILTTARGLLSEDTSMLRRRRGLVGQGLIA
jgi:hypothetical protein